MSYQSFKIISIVVLLVILLGVIIAKKSNANQPKENKDESSIEQTPITDKDQLRKSALCYLEYNLLPVYVDILERNPDFEVKLIDVSYWKRDIVNMADPQYIEWDEISCEIVGDTDSDYFILYEFPEPFEVPLAKYGTVYINRQKQMCSYYTLEKSLNGYTLYSTTTEVHSSFGERGELTKEGFIKEICRLLDIDDASQKEWRLVKSKESTENPRNRAEWEKQFVELKDLAELGGFEEVTDDNYKEWIESSPYVVICYYDMIEIPGKRMIGKQSKWMLRILSSIIKDYKDRIKLGVSNVYSIDNEAFREANNIMALPTVLFFKDGKVVKRHIGMCSESTMNAKFVDFLGE